MRPVASIHGVELVERLDGNPQADTPADYGCRVICKAGDSRSACLIYNKHDRVAVSSAGFVIGLDQLVNKRGPQQAYKRSKGKEVALWPAKIDCYRLGRGHEFFGREV